MEKLKCLIVKPSKVPKEKDVDNNLRSFQEIVNGHIECIYPWEDIIVICNEEGKIKNLTPNRFVRGHLIVGTFIIIGNNHDGEFRSLTEEEIKTYKKLFGGKTFL